MANQSAKVVILVTCANSKEAERIASALLKDWLVACVNIVGKVKSMFWWQGKIDNSREVLLIIKTKKAKLGKIIKLVKAMHSYQMPEIIALPIASGYKPYLNWIDDSLRGS